MRSLSYAYLQKKGVPERSDLMTAVDSHFIRKFTLNFDCNFDCNSLTCHHGCSVEDIDVALQKGTFFQDGNLRWLQLLDHIDY